MSPWQTANLTIICSQEGSIGLAKHELFGKIDASVAEIGQNIVFQVQSCTGWATTVTTQKSAHKINDAFACVMRYSVLEFFVCVSCRLCTVHSAAAAPYRLETFHVKHLHNSRFQRIARSESEVGYQRISHTVEDIGICLFLNFINNIIDCLDSLPFGDIPMEKEKEFHVLPPIWPRKHWSRRFCCGYIKTLGRNTFHSGRADEWVIERVQETSGREITWERYTAGTDSK